MNINSLNATHINNYDNNNNTIAIASASSSHGGANDTAANINNGNNTQANNNLDAGGGGWLDMPKLDNVGDIFSLCCSTAVILGGLVPYIPQYLKIKKASNSDGFSTYVCLTLLLANILRIAFWFGHRFETPLLLQSFVMIAGMLAMMEICVRVRAKNSPYIISAFGNRQSSPRLSRYSMIRLNAGRFWDWDNLINYIKFLSLFTIVLSSITYILLDNYVFVETLGFVAVFTESMLGMPQLIRNYVKKSTRGMSVEMVIMWLSGDLFKTLYFILRHAPVQFIACGAIQVCVDILILFQVFWYGRPNVTYSKLPNQR